MDSGLGERRDGVEQLTLSPDGSRSAYTVGGNTVVLDGEKQKQYDSVSALTFSTDGSRLAYIKGGLNFGEAVLDEEEQKRYPFGCSQLILKWSCVTGSAEGVEVDGQPLETLDLVDRNPADLVFSIDGKSLALLTYETSAIPSSITRLHLETLDVP